MAHHELWHGPGQRGVCVAIQVNQVWREFCGQLQKNIARCGYILPRVFHPFELVTAFMQLDVFKLLSFLPLFRAWLAPHGEQSDAAVARLDRAFVLHQRPDAIPLLVQPLAQLGVVLLHRAGDNSVFGLLAFAGAENVQISVE